MFQILKDETKRKSGDDLLEQFQPNFYYTHYTQLTPDWLNEQGVKFILADLDGTLAPQDEAAGEAFDGWLSAIQEAGVGLVIVSNNTQKRVDAFVSRHKIVGLGDCKKPRTKTIEEKLFYKGLQPETTIFLGDQLFTDIWCANKMALRSVLVNSIPGKEDAFRKVKRSAENYLLKRWKMK